MIWEHFFSTILFFFHCVVLLYAGIGIEECTKKSSSELGYFIASLVVGWTALLVALSTLPDKAVHTFYASLPIAGMAAWGAYIISTYKVLDTQCARARAILVASVCFIQISELCLFCLFFMCRMVFNARRNAPESRAGSISNTSVV